MRCVDAGSGGKLRVECHLQFKEELLDCMLAVN